MKKLICLLIYVVILNLCSFGQDPVFKHVFDIRAEISGAIDVGDVPHGKRIVIPITGGEVTGMVNGKILPGGADYQIIDRAGQQSELKAIYTIMTDDSVPINVTNEGINRFKEGDYYFMTSPKFECDKSSKYGWLNNRIFVCRPVKFENNAIVLRVWEVN